MSDRIRERAHWIARNILPHEPAIRGWLAKSPVDGLAVDDVIQEMYARIVSQKSLEAIRYPKIYAFQTAKSVVIDHVRRARIVSVYALGNLDDLQIPAPHPSPEESVTFRDELAAIGEALAAMAAVTREVLILRRVEGLSQRETAKRLSISEKTVEKHLARGTLLLMNRLGRGGKPRARPSKNATRATADRANQFSSRKD